MKDPAFLFYSQDFLTGTYLMTDEQVGKYIRLLCLQHQKGSLSEKDMMKICKSYDEDIFCKFIKEGETYHNERLKNEAEKRKAYSDSRRNNRKKNNSDTNSSNEKDMKIIRSSHDERMENENENEIVNENEVENFKYANCEKLKNTRQYIENVQVLFNMSESDVKKEIDRFWLEKQYTGELDKSQNEVFSHFKNWLKKNKTNGNNKGFNSGQQRDSAAIIAEADAIIERAFGKRE